MAVQIAPNSEGVVNVGVEGNAVDESNNEVAKDRTNNALLQYQMSRDANWSLGEDTLGEWWTAVIEWILCPPPFVERTVRILLCIALHASFITLLVTGLVGGNIGEDYASTVPTNIPLVIDLTGCALVIRHRESGLDAPLRFRNTTQQSAWRSFLALNVWSDGSSSNRVVLQDCGDHTRLVCEVLQAEPGYVISAVLEVAEGTPLPATTVVGNTQERSDLVVEGAVNFAAGLKIAGFEMHVIATDLQTSDFSAKISHGLVDVRGASFSSATVEIVEEGAVSWHSLSDMVLHMPNEADPGNLCLSSETASPPALNSTGSASSFLLTSASARRQKRSGTGVPQLTVLRKFSNVSQVHVAAGPRGAHKTPFNTLDSTPGAMRIQANLSQAVQLAIDGGYEVLRFRATGPNVAEDLNLGQSEFVWVKQGASYLWLSLPWMWISSMTFFAPPTYRISVVVQEAVCLRKEEVLVQEATAAWVCPALTINAEFRDYEDLYSLLLPELQLDASANASQAELKMAASRSTFEQHEASSWAGVLTGSLAITALNDVYDFRAYSNVVGSRVRIQDPASDRMGPAGRTLLALHWIIATMATLVGVVYIKASFGRIRRKHLRVRGDELYPGVWTRESGVVISLLDVDGGRQEVTLEANPVREPEVQPEGGMDLHIKVGVDMRRIEWRGGGSRDDGRLQGAERRVIRLAKGLPAEVVGDEYAIFCQTHRAKCRKSLLLWYFVDMAVAMEAQGYSQCPCVGFPAAIGTVLAHFVMSVAIHLLPGALSLALVLVDVCHCCTSYRMLAAGDCQDRAVWPAILVGSVTIASYVCGLIYTLVYYASDLADRQELVENPTASIKAWRGLRKLVQKALMAMLTISMWWLFLTILWLALGALVQPYKFVPLLLGAGLVIFTARETYIKLKDARKSVKDGLKQQIKLLHQNSEGIKKQYREAKRLLVEEGVTEEGILMFTVMLAVMLLLSVVFILIGVTSFLTTANLTSTIVSSVLMLSTALAVLKAGGGKSDKIKTGKGAKQTANFLNQIGQRADDAAHVVSPSHAGRS